MNIPIIDPMIFYWIGVFENIKNLFVVILVLLVSYIITAGLVYFVDIEESHSILIKKYIKIPIIVSIMLSIMLTFTPTKETIYTMLISKQVTQENVNITTETIKNTVDYIIDKTKGDVK